MLDARQSSRPEQRLLFVRFLRWMMARRGSRVQAMTDALRLQRSMRIIGLGSVDDSATSMLLAYFGISSIQGEELAVMDDVKNQADVSASAFVSQSERPLTGFEDAVLTDSRRGPESGFEALKSLHKDVLLHLLDADLRVSAPFSRSGTSRTEPIEYLFEPAVRRAISADRRGEDAQVVSRLYVLAEQSARSNQSKARLRFDRATLLAANGRGLEARAIMDELVSRYGQVRDPWGFRMEDLVALIGRSPSLDQNPLEAAEALRALVDKLMNRRWAVGMGGEGAVARRAMSELERSPSWRPQRHASASTIAIRMLYWAEKLRLESLMLSSRGSGTSA